MPAKTALVEEETTLVFIQQLAQVVLDMSTTLEGAFAALRPEQKAELAEQRAQLARIQKALGALLPPSRQFAVRSYVIALIAAR